MFPVPVPIKMLRKSAMAGWIPALRMIGKKFPFLAIGEQKSPSPGFDCSFFMKKKVALTNDVFSENEPFLEKCDFFRKIMWKNVKICFEKAGIL